MTKNNNDLVVRKSNKLIQDFKFSLSKAEIRVVNFIIANIKSPLYDDEFNTLDFNISDYYKYLGIKNPAGTDYEYLKHIVRGLRNKTSDWVQIGDYETIVSWIEKPTFYPNTGRIKLKLDDDLKPYLLKMNGYITAELNYYFEMTSKYSMRLYELLKSYEGFKKKIFEVDELKKDIDAMLKSYSNFGKFRQAALEPAVREINEITDLVVSYKEIKTGVKITHIEFTISKEKKSKAVIDEIPGQMEIYDYPDIVPEEETKQTAEELYVQRVNNEAFNNEFTAEKAAYLIEIGKVRAQERVSEENLFDADAANAEKINYYREKYLQMRAGSTSKTVAGRAKYLEKILIAERDAGDELPEPANHKKSKNKFNNFHQREYNIGELEQQLLNSQK